jgi:hypothetical protein
MGIMEEREGKRKMRREKGKNSEIMQVTLQYFITVQAVLGDSSQTVSKTTYDKTSVILYVSQAVRSKPPLILKPLVILRYPRQMITCTACDM